jgi:hypothetical protein
MFSDWKAVQPVEKERKGAAWAGFIMQMQEYYRPTENPTLKNFQFRAISQAKNETFTAFCNRVDKEAKHCQFKCIHEDCTAEVTAIRDQIVIGIMSDEVRVEALKKSWSLSDLRREGMHMESAVKGASEIAGDGGALNKLGRYSYKHRKKDASSSAAPNKVNCYFCGQAHERHEIAAHSRQCSAKAAMCNKCNKVGHYSKVCRSEKAVKGVDFERAEDEDDAQSICNISLFRLRKQDHNRGLDEDADFKVQVVVNNKLGSVLADIGAKVSVCGINQARNWNLLDNMINTKVKIKPYKSKVIYTHSR